MDIEKEYWKHLADKICVCKEDMLPNEITLIKESYILFKEKMDDIKIVQDELKRVSIELANLKAMQDDKEYEDDE